MIIQHQRQVKAFEMAHHTKNGVIPVFCSTELIFVLKNVKQAPTHGGIMRLHNLPVSDLVHIAKHGMTEEVATFAVREFIKRPEGTILMCYHIIHSARYMPVKIIAEAALLNRKDATHRDIVWIALHAHQRTLQLEALWKLSSIENVSALHWSALARDAEDKTISLRAQEHLVMHEKANADDLLFLDENGLTDDIRKKAQERLRDIFE